MGVAGLADLEGLGPVGEGEGLGDGDCEFAFGGELDELWEGVVAEGHAFG